MCRTDAGRQGPVDMKPTRLLAAQVIQLAKELTAIICIAGLALGNAVWAAPPQQAAPASSDTQAAKLPNDQLDSLVAPIALYPDPLLSQVLIACTYPLEIIQLQQWLGQNKNLKDKALADAVQKQDWDPSVQALAALPDIVKQLSENIKWTTELGNAFLAQQDDVMAAVQRMRKAAQDKGNLKSNEQMKVETKTVESKQVIVIEQGIPRSSRCPAITRPWYTARPSTHIRLSTTLRRAITPPAWQYRLVWASLWVPCGAAAGVAAPGGAVAAITFISTTTTISSTITTAPTTPTAVTATTSATATVATGSTTHSTAEGHPTLIASSPTNTEVALEATPCRAGRTTHARTRHETPAQRPVTWRTAPGELEGTQEMRL